MKGRKGEREKGRKSEEVSIDHFPFIIFHFAFED
jgi:hypothetical protein